MNPLQTATMLPVLIQDAAEDLTTPRADDRSLRCHYVQCRARLFLSFRRRLRHCRRCSRPFSAA